MALIKYKGSYSKFVKVFILKKSLLLLDIKKEKHTPTVNGIRYSKKDVNKDI